MAGIKTETLIVLGVALAVVYMAKKAADKTTQLVKDGAQAVNPFNQDNVFNKAATDLWQYTTGSKGTIGSDIYDYMHKGEPLPDGSLLNYTPAQQAADALATQQLLNGPHGM